MEINKFISECLSAEGLFGKGLTKSQIVKKSFLGSTKIGVFGGVVGLGMVGFQANRAGRGGFVPSIVGQGTAIAVGIPLAGFASAAVAFIPGVGPVAAMVMGGLLSDYAELRIGSSLIKKVRYFTDLDKNMRHLQMGGDYKDTELAYRQRQIAIQDMQGALIPGRRYLGQEARLMHR